jgi:hypothetical protein
MAGVDRLHEERRSQAMLQERARNETESLASAIDVSPNRLVKEWWKFVPIPKRAGDARLRIDGQYNSRALHAVGHRLSEEPSGCATIQKR